MHRAVVFGLPFAAVAVVAGSWWWVKEVRPAPDFVAERLDTPVGPAGYCKTINNGESLELGVKNQGAKEGTAELIVEFLHGTPRSATTGSIPPNQVGTVVVSIPTPIPTGGFDFTVRIDPNGKVREMDETNNIAPGHCTT